MVIFMLVVFMREIKVSKQKSIETSIASRIYGVFVKSIGFLIMATLVMGAVGFVLSAIGVATGVYN